ncbi:T9SS type A sorting domain-containing protein, partial [Flavobacteriales bacterium]|nr:T9SS type A sorting domain-containing protein [Flavobacteriales bacterium]
ITVIGNYSISLIESSDLPNGCRLILQDLLLSTSHDLNTGPYNYSGDPVNGVDRFEINVIPNSITSGLNEGEAITNLDIYPNPSKDIFNVTFTSEEIQNIGVRVLNIVGEVIYTKNLDQFVGEYTKAIDLATYTKGVYFLEITTNKGVINKKVILH